MNILNCLLKLYSYSTKIIESHNDFPIHSTAIIDSSDSVESKWFEQINKKTKKKDGTRKDKNKSIMGCLFIIFCITFIFWHMIFNN